MFVLVNAFVYSLMFACLFVCDVCVFVCAQVQSSIGKQAQLIFLNALLAQKKNKPPSQVIPVLTEAADVHFGTIKVGVASRWAWHLGGRGILEGVATWWAWHLRGSLMLEERSLFRGLCSLFRVLH